MGDIATIVADTYLDGGTARSAGEAWTCNGGKLTIRTDTRWHANAPASMTGSLGATTVSATLGGGVLIDGRNVRWLPYNTGTGNVPAIGTSITQGGVSGYLLAVYDTLTSAPTAVAAAMPADGFIKFREVTGGAFSSGALTGIGASATGPDVTGWIEVVQDQVTVNTISRKGTGHVVRGDWFYLDNTTGTLGQVLQVPTNGGGAATYCPGVWVETGVSSGVYEYWPELASASANGWAVSHLGAPEGGTDRRQRFVKGLGSGQMQFGETATQASTYAAITQAATYTWTNDVIAVTFTAHGWSVGQQVYLDFTSGTGVDGVYTVEQVTSANAFTVASAGNGTSGNVTVAGKATITFTAHGLSQGQQVYLDATSGAMTDGTYEILSVTDANNYVVLIPQNAVSTGNVTARFTIGAVPVSGCRTRIPNVFLRQCTTGARATNARPHATIGSRPTFTTTGAGSIDHEYAYSDWYYNFAQPYAVRLQHTAAGYDAVAISECATAIDMLDGGVSMNQTLDLVTFTLTSCFAGGTIDGWKFHRGNVPGANDHAVSVSLCAGQTFINCEAGIIQTPRSSGLSWNLSQSKNLTLDTCRGINGGATTMTTCANVTITDYDHVDRFIGRTNAVSATYAFAVQSKSADVMIDGVTEGYAGTVSRVHAYAGLINITSSDRVTFRNAGTRAAPIGPATNFTNAPNYVYLSGGNNSAIKIQRAYLTCVRTSVLADTNSDKDVVYESVSAPHLSTFLPYTVVVAALNAVVKGCKAPLLQTGANASVYGTHIQDYFTSWFRQLSSYTWSANVVTVTFTAHGLQVGDLVYLKVTSGTLTSDWYYVRQVTGANTYTIYLTGSGTSGNAIAFRDLWAGDNTVLFTAEGRIHIPMNEPTAETTPYVTLSGGAQFTSAPALTLPTSGSEVVFESQHTILGHYSFSPSPPILTGAPAVQASTYTWAANVLTVTFTAHGLAAGDQVYLDATSGTLPDGIYTIASITSANVYTVTLTGSGTAGNANAYRLFTLQYKLNFGSGWDASWKNLDYYRVNGSLTASSAVMTLDSTAGIAVNDVVFANGLPGQTKVQSIDSSTQITLTQNANLTSTAMLVRFSQLLHETNGGPFDASTGFKIRVRVAALTPGSTMSLTYLTIPTASDAASQDYLYPLDSVAATLELTGLKTNTEIRIYRTSDDVELAGIEDSGTSFTYDYTWTADVSVYIVIHALGYLPIRYEGVTLGSSGLSIPVQQQLDRQYLNP